MKRCEGEDWIHLAWRHALVNTAINYQGRQICTRVNTTFSRNCSKLANARKLPTPNASLIEASLKRTDGASYK